MTRKVKRQDPTVLGAEELKALDAHWRAANYLAVGQIYLMGNPLLTEELRPAHIKPRLLGHWGTSPGLNLVHTHLNRVIKARDLSALCIWGPGHGGPAVLANAWLEGSYSAVYPDVSRDAAGMERLFRQFSFPGGVPSHVAPETPGSIHEGGARLLPRARLRRSPRQSGAPGRLCDRRRRGRDRTACRLLALQQIPRPGGRRRGAADPPPQRLQDRQPDGPVPAARGRTRRSAAWIRP